MSKAMLKLAFAVVLLLGLPSAALAAPPAPTPAAGGSGRHPHPGDRRAAAGAAHDLDAAPAGFTTNAEQAVAIAKATSQMQSLHRREHPLRFTPLVWEQQYWEVKFNYRGRDVAAVDISRTGHVQAVWQGVQVGATYTRGHYGGIFDNPWVLIPFCLLFLLPFGDWRRPFRLLHLDALVLLSFGVSYALFDHGHFSTGVWLVYPPLIYLLVRMLAIGLRRVRPAMPPVYDCRGVLGAGVLLLVAARIALSLANPGVVDVGYASLLGAARAAHGLSLYYNTPAMTHYDTYGPINYLVYVPFELIWPWSGSWDSLPAAHAATLFFDLLTIGGLVTLGTRLRPGQAGWRLGLTLAWVWAAYPFTLLGVVKHTNDGLVAMFLVWSLVLFRSPVRRGVMLGLAAAAKFAPIILLPLYMAGRGERDRRAQVSCAVACAVVVGGTIALYLPSGGISEFYDHTIGYQLTRSDVFSLWALHPGLNWLKVIVEMATVVLAFALGWARGPRSIAQVAALAGALMVALQLPAVHWFYFYLVWFAPLVFVALFAREAGGPQLDGARGAIPLARSRPRPRRSSRPDAHPAGRVVRLHRPRGRSTPAGRAGRMSPGHMSN